MEELAGRSLGPEGKYRLLRVIGRGGMGVVFEAEQVSLRRRVAIKVANPAVTSQPGFTERFLQEAQAIALLEHAHILPVYDVGEDDGRLFLVTRLMTGGTLKNFIQDRGGQPCTPPETLVIAQQVLSALDYAHAEGIIHRDLKPSNVLLHGGQAFLADFGVAKLVQQDLGLTRPGMLMGTPDYMAPEQVLSKPLDGQADLYAFGVVLYEMLTGRVPFRGETPMAVALQHVQAPLPPPLQENPELSAEVAAVLTRSLAKEPAARYPTGAAFGAALAQAVDVADRKARGRGQWSRLFGGWRRTDAERPGAPTPAGTPTSGPAPTPVSAHSALPAAAAGAAVAGAAAAAAPPALTPAPPPPLTPALAPAPPPAPPPVSRPAVEADEPPLAEATPSPGGTPADAPPGPEGASWWTRTLTRPADEDAPPLHPGDASEAAPAAAPGRPGHAGAGGRRDGRERPTGHARDPRRPAGPGPRGRNPGRRRRGARAGARRRGDRGDHARPPAAPPRRRYGPAGGPPREPPDGPSGESPGGPPGGPQATPAGRSRRRNERLIVGGVLAVVAVLALLPWLRPGALPGLPGLAAPAPRVANPPSPTVISPAPPLSSPRSSHTATVLRDGKVLVVGGREGARYLATAEMYDPATNRWTPAGGGLTARTGHTATTMANGTVLVVGGQSTDTSYTANAERYDPATNSWSPAATMTTARTGHTATALPGGGVLVAGG